MVERSTIEHVSGKETGTSQASSTVGRDKQADHCCRVTNGVVVTLKPYRGSNRSLPMKAKVMSLCR